MKKHCLIRIYEEKSRVSTDFILQDARGALTRKNNWTFDILSERLFRAIFRQIMDHEDVEKCYIVLPDKSDFSEECMMQINMSIVRKLLIERDVEIEFLKSYNAANELVNIRNTDVMTNVVGF